MKCWYGKGDPAPKSYLDHVMATNRVAKLSGAAFTLSPVRRHVKHLPKKKPVKFVCLICQKVIVDVSKGTQGQVAITCDSHCKMWLHRSCSVKGCVQKLFCQRRCSTLSVSLMMIFCPQCRLDTQSAGISWLKAAANNSNLRAYSCKGSTVSTS